MAGSASLIWRPRHEETLGAAATQVAHYESRDVAFRRVEGVMIRSLIIISTLLAMPLPVAIAQAPLHGPQWRPIADTLHDLIHEGYALSAVNAQTLRTGQVSTTYYLSMSQDLVRCREALERSGQRTTIFPCERLTVPR